VPLGLKAHCVSIWRRSGWSWCLV